jgi:polysaccharide deacetylase 2 family uncharacterized protein YibQ
LAARWAGTGPRQRFGSLVAGWRGLGLFWLVVLLLLAVSGVTLQELGPPTPPSPRPVLAAQTPRQQAAQPVAPPPAQPQATEAKPAPRPGRDTPGPIADPDPALLEPMTGQPAVLLPRIAMDGRMPMQLYAAGFDQSTRRPRVGLLLAGVGLNQADSEAAIRTLPSGITLAFSPYAVNPTKLLAAARLAEHEYLLSLPMEPQGFPLNDPGPQAMMASLPPEQNHQRLEWALSRMAGYVGATGALGTTHGERFAALPDQMNPVLTELAQRGLLYVDARPGAAALPVVWGRAIDIIIDDPATAADIDDKLGQLARLAREKGSALGLATVVRPVTVDRIVAWAGRLAADGLALAPVSALVQPPGDAAK